MPFDLVSRESLQAIDAFMRAHAAWAAPILFGVMALEGVIVTTFIFSGALFIVMAGAMVQAGVLDYGQAFAAMALGFWLGDTINYELGLRAEHRIRGLGVVKSRPGLVARAEAMIARYGWMAIFASRFLGPLRPFVTLIAGACRMPRRPFHVATVISTLLLVAGLMNAGMVGVQLWDRLR